MNIKDSYQYIARKDDTWTSIGIRGGKFDGVVYKYGKVTLPEEETPKGDLPFKFEYDILDPYGLKQEDFDNFKNLSLSRPGEFVCNFSAQSHKNTRKKTFWFGIILLTLRLLG